MIDFKLWSLWLRATWSRRLTYWRVCLFWVDFTGIQRRTAVVWLRALQLQEELTHPYRRPSTLRQRQIYLEARRCVTRLVRMHPGKV